MKIKAQVAVTELSKIMLEQTDPYRIASLEKAMEAIPAIRDCRNELCYRCGEYKNSHLGACRGCRWEDSYD